MTINETNTQPDPLPSLARVVHGTSMLFWGLPFAMVVSIMATTSNWTDAVWPLGMLLPPVAFSMLWYALWLLRSFQLQERVWQEALGEVKLLGLINLGLSPFLHWHHRAPDELGFANAVGLLALVFVFYLMSLNIEPPELLLQLTAMTARLQPWLFMAFVLVCVLIPLSMTMSLLWKTKESILTSVFHSRH